MREQFPFGIDSNRPPYQVGGPTALNYLDIEAVIRMITKDGRPHSEVEFGYNPWSKSFIPRGIHVKWKEIRQLELHIKVAYDIYIPGPTKSMIKGHGSGRYERYQVWDVKFGDNGITLLP